MADSDPYVNGTDINGGAHGWSSNGQRDYRLVDAIADVADLIYRALESGGREIDLTRRQIDLTQQPGNNNLLIPLPRVI